VQGQGNVLIKPTDPPAGLDQSARSDLFQNRSNEKGSEHRRKTAEHASPSFTAIYNADQNKHYKIQQEIEVHALVMQHL